MLYQNATAWRAAPHRKVLVFGMSGLGKTHLSGLLRGSGDWFHYSIDYRIGTRYLNETILDNAKAEAMKVPLRMFSRKRRWPWLAGASHCEPTR